jgi:hypothetical protein
MSKKSMTEKFIKTMNNWTDEECLTAFGTFLERVGVTAQFIQNDEGLLTHQVLVTVCGDKVMTSDPQQLDWPLQPLPMPEALKAKELN